MSERVLYTAGKHRKFYDNAGYAHHCWECCHAHNWTKDGLYGYPWANCDMRDMHAVAKYSSPNNGCSWIAGCPYYKYIPPKSKGGPS